MGSSEIRARMKEVRASQSAVRSARQRLMSPISHAMRLVRSAERSSTLVAALIGGSSSGADLEIESRLQRTVESGNRFRRELESVIGQLDARSRRLELDYSRLERELERAVRAEESERSARLR